MVAVPVAAPPVNTPVAEPMLAIVVLLLAHVPPLEASVKVIVVPEQTLDAPGAAGIALTVT